MAGPAASAYSKVWKAVSQIIKGLVRDAHCWAFQVPVDEVRHEAPNYYTVIKHPQDLKTITNRLRNKQYTHPSEVERDVLTMFENARVFNDAQHVIHKAAIIAERGFKVMWQERQIDAMWRDAERAQQVQPPCTLAQVCMHQSPCSLYCSSTVH